MRPQFVLCADSTHDRREIIVREKGGVWVEMRAQGIGAHAAYLWKGENALDKIIGAIEKIRQWVGPVVPEAWKSTCNLAVLETTNKTPNKVPADARAVLDIRFTEELAKDPDELLEKIRSLVPEVEVHVLTKVFPLYGDEQNPFLQKFKQVSDEILGEPVPFHYGHGATDARYFAALGIPSVIFGAVGGNYHAKGEWVDIKSLEQNKEILLRFLQVS
jgi:succinyl-diaminopimelate desuccinylase